LLQDVAVAEEWDEIDRTDELIILCRMLRWHTRERWAELQIQDEETLRRAEEAVRRSRVLLARTVPRWPHQPASPRAGWAATHAPDGADATDAAAVDADCPPRSMRLGSSIVGNDPSGAHG
jgi:hypothetical protein